MAEISEPKQAESRRKTPTQGQHPVDSGEESQAGEHTADEIREDDNKDAVGADSEEQEAGTNDTSETAEGSPPDGDQQQKVAEYHRGSPLPQSDTFSEGEAEEPAGLPQIGELLSRGQSPVEKQGEEHAGPAILEPGTPSRAESYTGESDEDGQPKGDEEEESDDTHINREELLERYHVLMEERGKIHQQNAQLQNKLAEYFRKKKGDETKREMEKAVSDQEQRYLKYMASLEELRTQYKQDSEHFQQHIDELRARCQEKQEQVDCEWQTLLAYKKKVAVAALSRRWGKQAAIKEVEQLQEKEQRKENEVIQVRLENIKLKNKIKKFETSLKAKEELAEGLHLIDFEQLKIENQTYNEKIEERNEELLKLRKKITSTVQVLTHLKEKLQFVQAENQRMKGQLMEVEASVAQKRDILTRTKQARDSLRIDNLKLRQQSGLLSNKVLLRDFEVKVTNIEEHTQYLETLKRRYAELTLNCHGIKTKIEQARSVSQ